MQIYLPIAEMSVNIFLLLGMGAGVGFLAGMFGVGGGFLMTPLLIFIGVSPAVAVATEANQVVAASVSGVMAHWRRNNVDLKMGGVLVVGGLLGSALGTWIFREVRLAGQVDLLISFSYIIFLGVIGWLMLAESVTRIIHNLRDTRPRRKAHVHFWVHGLPLKMRFHRSKLYTSVIPPVVIGFVVGILAAIMGVGGGFIMVPAMIYLLGMPTTVAVGTSLFHIIFITANVTFLHSITNQTVDALLALVLLAGAVVGAQIGTTVGVKLRGEQLRALLALIVLGVCARLVWGIVATPGDPFSVEVLIAG